MFDAIKARIARLRTAPARILEEAAPLVEAQLKSDARTRRGNVPSFGDRGDVPISVEVRAKQLDVRGPDWVLKKAQEKGQTAVWAGIVQRTARRILGGG